MMIPPQI